MNDVWTIENIEIRKSLEKKYKRKNSVLIVSIF